VGLLNTLNEIAARHGRWPYDLVEKRLVGMKSRGAYETPGGTLLVTAHRGNSKRLTVDRETAHLQQSPLRALRELVTTRLFSTQRQALDGFFKRFRRSAYWLRRPETLEGLAQRHES